jgi:hypothetical protein
MGIFSGIRPSGAAEVDASNSENSQQKVSNTADSPNLFARVMLGFVGLTGIGGGAAALVDNTSERENVSAAANSDGTILGEQFISTTSGVSKSFGDLVHSWADSLKPPDDPLIKSAPQTEFDSVSIGMAADDSLSSPQDLIEAAGEPSWIKRLTIGRFVDVADEGLPLSRFTKLTDISVIGCEKLTGGFLGDLSKDVKRVLLENMTNLDGANLSGLCDSHSLRDLTIRGCPISIAGLTRISKMQSLESLVLVDTGRSLTEVLIALPEKGLRNVVIGGFQDLGEDELKKIQEWVDKQNVSVTLDQGDTIIEFLPRSDRRSYGLQGA